MKKDFFLLTLLTITSLLFKSWFVSLAPQPIIYDQTEYREMAQKIYHNIFSVKASRTYAYPAFLAVVFSLFGENNAQGVFLIQLVIDILTGYALFFLGYTLFHSKPVAYFACIIQLFNPFTTAYIAVLLTEVSSAFLIISMVILFYLSYVTKKLRYIFLLGLTAGILTQARPAFFYWNFLLFFLTPLLFKHILGKKKQLQSAFIVIALLFLGTMIAFFYQIAGNLKFYNQFSFTTVDAYLGRELYDGALLKQAPLFPDESEDYPIEMRIMYAEYSDVPKNAAERKAMSDKYLGKALEIIKKDPIDYAVTRVKKMWSMWQKPNIFFYQEPGFDNHWIYTYIANAILLALATAGIYFGLTSRERTIRTVTFFCLSIIAYMTVAISFTHAEPRLTLPAYPLLFLFSAYGVQKILSLFA